MTEQTNLAQADLSALKAEFMLLAQNFSGMNRPAKQSVFAQMAAIKQTLIARLETPGADLSPEAAHAVAHMNFALAQFAPSLGDDDA